MGFFLFPDDLIRKRQINPSFLRGEYPDVRRLSREIIEKEAALEAAKRPSNGREQNEENMQETITLLDVFEKVERADFPDVWSEVL